MTPRHPVLEKYTEEIEPKFAFVKAEATDAKDILKVLETGQMIATKEEYIYCGELLAQTKGKFKFLDEERTISVKPLNDEVKFVNDWYRPALDSLKKIKDIIEKRMAEYVLQQRREEARLLAEAEAAARKIPEVAAEDKSAQVKAAGAMITQAANVAPPKLENISEKIVWKFEVTQPEKLDERFLKKVPDLEKIGAWVDQHGDQDVPAGVKVSIHGRFTVRN